MVAPPNTLRAHEQQPHFQTFNSSHTGSRIPRSSLPNPVRVRLDSSEQNFGPPVPRPVHTHTHTHTYGDTYHGLRSQGNVISVRRGRRAEIPFSWPRPKACMLSLYFQNPFHIPASHGAETILSPSTPPSPPPRWVEVDEGSPIPMLRGHHCDDPETTAEPSLLWRRPRCHHCDDCRGVTTVTAAGGSPL